MELATEPDIYCPSLDDQGNYIDKIPLFHIIKKGIYCPCGSRKDKIYNTHPIFSGHIKTKCHQKWLESVNQNKVNMYIENEQLKETGQNQRLIIAKLERDILNKSMTIDYLTQQLLSKPAVPVCAVSNLLDF
jgi:hypothetical protein